MLLPARKAVAVAMLGVPATLACGQAPSNSRPQEPPPFHLNTSPEQQQEYQKQQEERLHKDWAYLERYREENAKLPPPSRGESRVVFLGDSITEGWGQKNNPVFRDLGDFFPGKGYINRGISGQTTPQMLVRLRPDVINLQPAVMILLAGTNDIAGNTGPMSLEETENNLRSMVELAQVHGIRVVLCTVPPAKRFWWNNSPDPSARIRELNAWIKSYAAAEHLALADYYSILVDTTGGLRSDLSPDGVHPNGRGYALMAPAVQAAINQALAGQEKSRQ